MATGREVTRRSDIARKSDASGGDSKVEEPKIIDLPRLRDRTPVFRDRAAAGKVLAGMLEGYRETKALVMGIPAGGMAVAVETARELDLPLDVAVVSKITLPWNTEAGYGAVAFDGTVLLNEELLSRFHLSSLEIESGIKTTKDKVARRVKLFRNSRAMPVLKGPVVLIDDGLASGFTLRVAIKALGQAGASEIVVAVPTAHLESAKGLSEVEAIYCANLRGGSSFAVADAYEDWSDLAESEAVKLFREFGKSR
jgi:predicted phosphoribosyltransferase